MSSHSDDEDDSISGQSTESNEKHTSTNSSSDHDRAGNDKAASKKEQVQLVQTETRQVLLIRLVVVIILLCSAAAVSYLMFRITSKTEERSLNSHYESAAAKLTDVFVDIAENKMGAAGSLVVAAIAEGMTRRKRWPFVSLSAFQERASTMKSLSEALYVGFNPLVAHDQRDAWENYTMHDPDRNWYIDSHEYQQELGIGALDNRPQIETDDPNLNVTSGIANHIYNLERVLGSKAFISPEQPFYLPVWQTSPVTRRSMVNQNRASNSQSAVLCISEGEVVFDGMRYSTPGYGSDPNPVTAEIAWLQRMANGHKTEYKGDAFTNVFFPIFDTFDRQRKTVGVMRIVILWARYFQNVLTTESSGVVVVLENGCDEPYTYQINGPNVTLLGRGDLHDHSFDGYEKKASFAHVHSIADGTSIGLKLSQGNCTYAIRVYPSDDFTAVYKTRTPMAVTTSVVCVFVFTILMFFVYDYLVERRQKLIMQKAVHTHDIVASLFPKNVRERLFEDEGENKRSLLPSSDQNKQTKTFHNGNVISGRDPNAPVADLFPCATVLFADISGFTAWSSSREPVQVFILLQSLYQEFDRIANRRKVFKVETIGDSYVAVTGLPDPQPKHALIMVRFAAECMIKAGEVFRELETTLGPETGELMIRFGLHSGPVTAGVLRGERARFQLFGDTVNTASRMESTGIPGKIHTTQATADELKKAGKEHWVRPREDSIMAKGKGVMHTFWIIPHAKSGTGNGSSSAGSSGQGTIVAPVVSGSDTFLKKERLVDWMVEILLENIKKVVARRNAMGVRPMQVQMPSLKTGHNSLDEVVEIIEIPASDEKTVTTSHDGQVEEASGSIVASLRELVATIAATYRDNPFHNFDHACHVTMCVSKFLKRIFSMEFEIDTDKLTERQDGSKVMKEIASHLHDYTHGITSDPITAFALIFSAFIHDMDHRGVSNTQLMKEDPHLSQYFRNKSIAEQNSLEIAWTILGEDRFAELRNYIFGTQQELLRFRQIIVNIVLATDIFDKDLNELRMGRWQKAFSSTSTINKETNGLRATIVMEHIIQASDVCHTMQHWQIYRKWNGKLFREMMMAYRVGRLGSDPSTFWYQGELGFFDNYVIPLAKKLQDCKVFGVSSDEVLNYALRNRTEWEARGKEIVEEMMEEFALPQQQQTAAVAA